VAKRTQNTTGRKAKNFPTPLTNAEVTERFATGSKLAGSLKVSKIMSHEQGVVNLAGAFDSVKTRTERKELKILPSSMADHETVAKTACLVSDENAVIIPIAECRQPKSATKPVKKRNNKAARA
jgi:hypothetical protein